MNNYDGDFNYGNNVSNDGRKKALVIAVSNYDSFAGLKSLEFCKNDGQEMYDILNKNGYDIPDSRKLIGRIDSQTLKNTIYDFFTDDGNKPDDTLVFYYSGHGVPDKFGTTYLAPSDMDSTRPFITGFSFDDLTNSMLDCNSLRVVTILDSCFSGSLKISKGLGSDSKSGEEAAARIANSLVEEKSEKLKQGVGRCLLAASQGYEEAYDRQEKDHSIFTYYLLQGLKGNKNAVDDEGNVTYDTLGKFIAREFGNLPAEKRPKQTPVRKGEVSGGEIVLASYPDLRKTKESDYYSLFGKGEFLFNGGNYKEALDCYEKILKFQSNNESILLRKGEILLELNRNMEAIENFENLLKLNPNNPDAWYFKSICYIKLKDYESALKSLDESFNMNPEDEKVKETYFIVKSTLSSIKKGKGQNNDLLLEKILKTKPYKKINENTYNNLNKVNNNSYNQFDNIEKVKDTPQNKHVEIVDGVTVSESNMMMR
jgi:tetratricopeptide (TPR) repeat protein